MAQSNEEIARDLVVAWLSHNAVSFNLNNPEKVGQSIGAIYTAVLHAVKEGAMPAQSAEVVIEPASRRGRGRFAPVGT
jgi:hypothetical protein